MSAKVRRLSVIRFLYTAFYHDLQKILFTGRAAPFTSVARLRWRPIQIACYPSTGTRDYQLII
eukprot:scaffold7679_cov134-Cylindrotheca_fusiformis.AAC.7